MITTTGKNHIKQFFGGQVPRIGDTLVFGTGSTAATLADTALATETYRLAVSSITADLDNDRIVFKVVIPTNRDPDADPLSFNEVGLLYVGQSGADTLISRVVLGAPLEPDPDLPTEIEFSLGITV